LKSKIKVSKEKLRMCKNWYNISLLLLNVDFYKGIFHSGSYTDGMQQEYEDHGKKETFI
jgi:hypothetical protein